MKMPESIYEKQKHTQFSPKRVCVYVPVAYNAGNLRLWSVIPIVVASNWQGETRRSKNTLDVYVCVHFQ